MNNIFVGNLSFKATKEDVQKLFEPFGNVADVVIKIGKKGTSLGYGFVDMPVEAEKNAAIAALEGKEFMWRVLTVSAVMPKVEGELKTESVAPVKKEQRLPKAESKTVRKDKRKSKAWIKSQSVSKSSRGDFKPARPWLKNESNTKLKKGFKMAHKVSGVPKKIIDG